MLVEFDTAHIAVRLMWADGVRLSVVCTVGCGHTLVLLHILSS